MADIVVVVAAVAAEYIDKQKVPLKVPILLSNHSVALDQSHLFDDVDPPAAAPPPPLDDDWSNLLC